MSKPISERDKQAFAEFVEQRIHDMDCDGAFCVDEVLDVVENRDEWEFHAQNHHPDTTCDLFELFDSHNGYQCEQHGYDDFCVVDRE